MEEFTLQSVQQLEFDILKYLKKICDENELRYYLAYGSLIGAVRHQGFIPWDDDIDVFMPRKDFNKLVEITNLDPHEYYKIICRANNSNFTAPLPKIIDSRTKLIQNYGYVETVELGVYVDIFLLDGAGNNLESAIKTYEQSYCLYKHWQGSDFEMFLPHKNKIFSFLKWIKNTPNRLKGVYYWLDRLEQHNSLYSFYDEKYVGSLEAGTLGAERNIWPREYFGNDCKLQFGDQMFRVPQNYDEILKLEYGNYMQLPPIEKRKTHHKYNLTWK